MCSIGPCLLYLILKDIKKKTKQDTKDSFIFVCVFCLMFDVRRKINVKLWIFWHQRWKKKKKNCISQANTGSLASGSNIETNHSGFPWLCSKSQVMRIEYISVHSHWKQA